MPALQHTAEEALKEFELIKGAGSEAEKKACAVTLLSWMRGVPWSDAPECASPVLASLTVNANDNPATTVEQQAELVRAGEDGLLDTWWVPGLILAWAQELREGDEADQAGRAKRMLERIAEWKAQGFKEKPVLRDADLSRADLSRADLRDADLRGADLSRAVLSRADLSGADLRDAVLRVADLRGADLSVADLRGADLSRAVLSRADLRGADLRDAVLRDADLRGALGTPFGGMPAGWKLSDAGLWMRA